MAGTRDIVWLLLVVAFFASCAPRGVLHLDLRDPRLPLEARRWLADAEDEVAIAQAHVEVAQGRRLALERYRDRLREQLILMTGSSNGEEARRAAGVFEQAYLAYAEERIRLQESNLEVAEMTLELARLRLKLARAETALRYDIAVTEVEPMVREVEALRAALASEGSRLEAQRAKVDDAAGRSWTAYTQYLRAGGKSHMLWSAPSMVAGGS